MVEERWREEKAKKKKGKGKKNGGPKFDPPHLKQLSCWVNSQKRKKKIFLLRKIMKKRKVVSISTKYFLERIKDKRFNFKFQIPKFSIQNFCFQVQNSTF